MIDDNLTVLTRRLQRYAEDPMWDAHADVPKILLNETIAMLATISRLTEERDSVMALNSQMLAAGDLAFAIMEDAVNALEAQNLHIDNPIYDRMRDFLEDTTPADPDAQQGGER